MWKPSKNEFLILLVLSIAAYLIRGIPSWFNWGWGNDFGIYYGLTKSLVDDPQLFKPYSGWGQTYHYFPILFIIMSGLHVITGIDVDVLLRVVSPVLGAVSVILFYFVVKHFDKGEYVPFFAALLLALNPFHAYQTAHAAPLTVGHLFLVLSLLLYLKKDKYPWAVHALYFSTILLIMSHHLATFVFILIIIGITFFRGFNATERRKEWFTDLIYIIFLTAFTFAYWAFIATPVFNSFMPKGLYLSPTALIGLFYVLIIGMFVFLEIKYRIGFTYKPRLLSKRTEYLLFTAILIILFAIIGVLTITDLGTGFSFLSIGLILLIPTIVLYVFGAVALNRIDFEPYGAEVKGIFYPLMGIFIFSVFTWNKVLLPFRFIEYLSYPLCILSSIGFFALLRDRFSDGLKVDFKFSSLKPTLKGAVVVFVVLIVLSGSTTYAIQRTTSRFEEAISKEVRLAVDYLEDNVRTNGTIASDHRISTILWEAGFNTTYDDAYDLWFSTGWNQTGCIAELHGNGVTKEFGRIDYVVIDSVMVRDGVQSNINETPRIITGKAYEKFNNPPFELLFEVASAEPDLGIVWGNNGEIGVGNGEPYPYSEMLSKPLPDALNWCRVYRVNWTFIEIYNKII